MSAKVIATYPSVSAVFGMKKLGILLTLITALTPAAPLSTRLELRPVFSLFY
jgi:hypothetical protein